MDNSEFLELSNKLVEAVKTNNIDAVNAVKYKFLCFGSNLLDIVANYISLNNYFNGKIQFDYGVKIIKKGNTLYRIREYNDDFDYKDSRQWDSPPTHPQNRANKEGEVALYLGNREKTCKLETHLKYGQKYALGKYRCKEDLILGGFFMFNPDNELHNIAGWTLNAFLIAPARSERNKELFAYLDEKYKGVKLEDLDVKREFELPYQFAVLNKRNEYYTLTNKICDILKQQYPDGIKYCSCYIPAETLGIECTDYNIVLYESGISKIEFIGSEIKENNENFTDVEIARIYTGVIDKVKEKPNAKYQ